MKSQKIKRGTKVQNTKTGRTGTIMNGFALIPTTGEWIEYEVETHLGIEVWAVQDLVVIKNG